VALVKNKKSPPAEPKTEPSPDFVLDPDIEAVVDGFYQRLEKATTQNKVDKTATLCNDNIPPPTEEGEGRQQQESTPPMPKDGTPTAAATEHFQAALKSLSELPPAQAITELEKLIAEAELKKQFIEMAVVADAGERQKVLQALQAEEKPDRTKRGTERKRRPYGAIKYARINAEIPETLKKDFVDKVKSEGTSQGVVLSQIIDNYININP